MRDSVGRGAAGGSPALALLPSLPLLVGLGAEKITDAVRLLWPTGVPQDEVNLAANKTQSIAELDRRGSSCPILFSWNGKEYEFIADMIGSGVVGHWIAPGERDVPDSDEYLKVPAKSARPKNGMLSFRFMEPMEETVYLDQVRLVAVDHPSKIEVNPNERFVSNPPFPEFRVIATENAGVPVGAWDDRGRNVRLGSIASEGEDRRQFVSQFGRVRRVHYHRRCDFVDAQSLGQCAAKVVRCGRAVARRLGR